VTHWKGKSEQICCKLKNTVQLPKCVISIIDDYATKVNGFDDDEVPAKYPPREALSEVLRALMALATPKCVSPLVSGTIFTSPPAYKSPNKWNLKAVIFRQFDKEEKVFDKEYQ
jgi:hypothetical protein